MLGLVSSPYLRPISYTTSPGYSAVLSTLNIAQPAASDTWFSRNRLWVVLGIGGAVLALSMYLLLSSPSPSRALANRRRLPRRRACSNRRRRRVGTAGKKRRERRYQLAQKLSGKTMKQKRRYLGGLTDGDLYLISTSSRTFGKTVQKAARSERRARFGLRKGSRAIRNRRHTRRWR